MPPIWSSSERPISVRTVWVEGIRHAILSHDDPFLNIKSRRRPQTSVTKDKSYPVKYEPYKFNSENLKNLENLENFLNNNFLNLSVRVEKKQPEKKFEQNLIRRQSAPCSKSSISRDSDLQMNSILNLIKNYKEEIKYKTDYSHEEDLFQSETLLSLRKLFDDDFDKTIPLKKSSSKVSSNLNRDTKESKSDLIESNKLEAGQLNPLSERVLQWLDLSGKVRTYKNEKEESSKELQNLEETSRRTNFIRKKTPLVKRENSASVSIQSYKLEEQGKEEETLKRIMKRRLFKTRDSQDSVSVKEVESQYFEDLYKVDLKNTEKISQLENSERETTWTPPGKPELHIFMPSLKSTERYSSQESLLYD